MREVIQYKEIPEPKQKKGCKEKETSLSYYGDLAVELKWEKNKVYGLARVFRVDQNTSWGPYLFTIIKKLYRLNIF
jgi:hypothetical protein